MSADRLNRIENKLDGLSNDVAFIRGQIQVVLDVEPRVGSLERFRSYCKGAVGVTAGLVAVLVPVVALFIK